MNQPGPNGAIEALDDRFAAALKECRDAYVTAVGDHLRIRQAGAAYIGEHFEVPATPFELTQGDPAIETFVVQAEKPIVPTGENQVLIELWQPQAQKMADLVLGACAAFGISLVEPGYLTVSALPLDQVNHEPHFDDDQYTPADGVSLVAIVGTHSGSRSTTEPILVPAVAPGAPISLPPDVLAAFDEGNHPNVQSHPERVIVLPQFGQLHSGPVLSDVDPHTLRTVYVLRFRTAGRPEPTNRIARRTRRR
ncbi:MAG: hypothetical protein ACN4GZ_04720 [Acidimicrobiales bacterium]